MSKVLSVSKMAEALKLSRSRFYQLLVQGFFPRPEKTHTGRPYYDKAGQDECSRCKETGVGVNGKVNVFYEKREKTFQP